MEIINDLLQNAKYPRDENRIIRERLKGLILIPQEKWESKEEHTEKLEEKLEKIKTLIEDAPKEWKYASDAEGGGEHFDFERYKKDEEEWKEELRKEQEE
jgi:hypothetical protein